MTTFIVTKIKILTSLFLLIFHLLKVTMTDAVGGQMKTPPLSGNFWPRTERGISAARTSERRCERKSACANVNRKVFELVLLDHNEF